MAQRMAASLEARKSFASMPPATRLAGPNDLGPVVKLWARLYSGNNWIDVDVDGRTLNGR